MTNVEITARISKQRTGMTGIRLPFLRQLFTTTRPVMSFDTKLLVDNSLPPLISIITSHIGNKEERSSFTHHVFQESVQKICHGATVFSLVVHSAFVPREKLLFSPLIVFLIHNIFSLIAIPSDSLFTVISVKMKLSIYRPGRGIDFP